MNTRFPAFLAAAVLSFGPAMAQEVFKSEVSAQFFGSFVSSTWYGGVQQSATDSAGVLANYRFFFNDYNGVEFNYAYTRDTQKYLMFQGLTREKSDTNEATAAYVMRYPAHRVVPFALLGGGALVFHPQNSLLTVEARPAFVYGAGFDLGFAQRYFLRAQYRGFVYSTPDFNTYYLSPERVTHMAEPSIGFGIRF